MVETIALPVYLLAQDMMLFPRLQRVCRLLFIFRPLEVLIAQRIVHSELALPIIDFPIDGLISIDGCERIRQVCPNVVAADRPFHDDIDDVGNAHSRALLAYP